MHILVKQVQFKYSETLTNEGTNINVFRETSQPWFVMRVMTRDTSNRQNLQAVVRHILSPTSGYLALNEVNKEE